MDNLFGFFILLMIVCAVVLFVGVICVLAGDEYKKRGLKMIIYSLIVATVGFGGCLLMFSV